MRIHLLSTTVLVGIACAAANPAAAACSNAVAGPGATVTCSGTDTTGVNAIGNPGVTVNVLNGARINTGGPGILLGSQGTISLFGNAQITSGASGGLAGVGISGDQGTITLNGSSTISTTADYGFGAGIFGDNGTITLNGNSAIRTTGYGSYGIFLYGRSGTVTLNGNASVSTAGENAAGIFSVRNGGAITLNDTASIRTSGRYASGIKSYGNNKSVTLNGNSSITTTGDRASAIEIQGDNNTVTLNDRALVSTSGVNVYGVRVIGDGSTLTLNGNAAIRATSDVGLAAFVQGNDARVTLNGNSSIRSEGFNGFGLAVISDNGTVTIGSGSSVEANTTGAPAVYVTGQDASLTNRGTLSNKGQGMAVAFFANNGHFYNAGTIIGGSNGLAIGIGGTNNTLTLDTGSHIVGAVDGGGSTLVLQGHGRADNTFLNFTDLTLANGDWALGGASTFGGTVELQSGRLSVKNVLTAQGGFVVRSGATLGGNGTLVGDVTSSGLIAPGDPVTLTINGNLAQTGGGFLFQFDQTGLDRLNVTGTTTLAGSPSLEVAPVQGSAGANGVVFSSAGGLTGDLGAVKYRGNGAATVIREGNDLHLLAVDGTPIEATAFAASQTGLDFQEAVQGQQLTGLRNCWAQACTASGGRRQLWGQGFGRFGNESARDGNQPFNYRIAGTAMGGDMALDDGLRLGGAFGYSNTTMDVAHEAANSDIDTTQAALYASYHLGGFFVTGALTGGWQGIDQERRVSVAGGTDTASSSTTGWLLGSNLQAGMTLAFPEGWTLQPSASVAYQHQWVEGYREHGAGAGNVAVDAHQNDALRLHAQLELARRMTFETMDVIPHLKIGVAEQFDLGGKADGQFSNGSPFDIALADSNRVVGLIGLGVDVNFAGGFGTFVNYDGLLSGPGNQHAVIGGLRYTW